MALQGIPEKSPGDLSAQVPTDRSFKVLEVDNVCCFEGLDFLNSRAVVRGTSSSAADRRALVQETWVLELILSPRAQTMLDILLGHAHYKTLRWITPTLLCAGATHDRGVEKAVHGHGSGPSTANKKLTDLRPLAEQCPDLPAVSPAHWLHFTFFFPHLFFLKFSIAGNTWTIKSVATRWRQGVIFKGTSVKICIYQRCFRDAWTHSLTCSRASEIIIFFFFLLLATVNSSCQGKKLFFTLQTNTRMLQLSVQPASVQQVLSTCWK